MAVFETVLVLLTGAVLLSALARRIGAPYPTLLAVAGAVASLLPVPDAYRLHLDPNLVLALFVAPVLLDAAYDASPRDLWRNRASVGGLVLVAVTLTTAAVAVVAHAMVPGLPWAAAVALGAIVAPPDAAAASAVLSQVRAPHRVATVLAGESLLNDASALLIYRVAVTAVAAGGHVPLSTVGTTFALSIVGSLVAGPALAMLTVRLVPRVGDVPSQIVMQFVITFGVWVLAERVGLSPVLTMVAYAVAVARSTPGRTPAHIRIPSYAVWETVVLVMNALAFVSIGLQLRPLITAAGPGAVWRWVWVAAAVLATVVGVRLAWVLGCHAAADRWPALRRHAEREPRRVQLIVGWCGMRGIVTLAAALALPAGFPHRDLLLFVAFAVAFGTLVGQGLTLRPLLRWAALPPDGIVDGEVRAAWAELSDVGTAALDGHDTPAAVWLRQAFAARRDGQDPPDLDLRRRTRRQLRDRLIHLRSTHVIGDDAFHRVEEELDRHDLAAGDP